VNTVKFQIGQEESIVVQKKWIKFDLKHKGEHLASYECSEEESYRLVQTALNMKKDEGNSSECLKLNDIL